MTRPPAYGPRTVVLALDDLTIAHAFARILEERGHEVHVAGTLLEALEVDVQDVLVADLDGGIDGLSLAGDLRACHARAAFVLLATNPSDEELHRAEHLGVHAILRRPFVPEDLLNAVESAPRSVVRTGLVPHELRAQLAARRGAAEAAARELIGWCARCEVTPPARARIGSAVAEVVQNSVDHGASRVELTAHLDGRTLMVEIVDDGPGFDVSDALAQQGVDAGCGLGRVYSLAEDVNVRSWPGGGATVHLTFRVSTIDFEDDARIDLSDLDYFAPATSRELLATLADDPHAPIILSPALAVVVGRMLVGPDPNRVLQGALRS